MDLLCEAEYLLDLRQFLRRFKRRDLNDSDLKLSVILFYLRDSSCILERFKVKERDGPASCRFIRDGKFELLHLPTG